MDDVINQLPENLTLSLLDGVLCLSATANPSSLLSVDFLGGALSFRSKQHLGAENLIKACRIKGRENVSLLDGTCGLGTDSFLLHQAGFSVTATERHPIIHALLADGLLRYQNQHQQLGFRLLKRDATELMDKEEFDVIYLDPMFPAKTKTAKNKKSMQLFQALHQEAVDQAKTMLDQAMKSAVCRVVIKRPTKSPVITSKKPTFQVGGKTCRFDVYHLA